MQVRPVDAAEPAALEPRAAVVAEACEHPAERRGARVELGAARVVLEAGKRPAGPLALEQHVADHPALTGDRLQRQQPDAGELLAVAIPVEASEQLVAAADSEHRRAAVDDSPQRVALAHEVARDERLLAILAAADVQQVDPVRHVVVETDRHHRELVATQAGALAEHGNVAAVGVDVQVVRVEVAHRQLHAAASQ